MLLKKKVGVGVLAALAALVALVVPSPANADPTPAAASCAASAIMFGACSVTFEDTAVGEASAVTVTVTADMGSDEITPEAPADPSFAITDDSCTGVALDMGDTCSFTITFTPIDDGDATAHGISTNMLVTTQQSMGMGNPVNIEATQHGSGGGGSPTPASASVAPSSFAFADTAAGEASAAKTFTVTSTSPTVLYISPATITGPDSDEYTITNDGCAFAALASVGQSCSVAVKFTPPSDASTGATSATLELPSGADPALAVPLIGTVTGTPVVHHPELTASPSTVDAGSVAIGDHADQTFTYTNTGDVALALTNATPGPGLTKTTDNCSAITLAVGDACTVTVRWTASIAGPYSGTVTVAGDASATGTLTGTAYAPLRTLTVSPTTLDAGHVAVGEHSADQTFTYTNTGDLALALTGVTVDPDLATTADTCSGQTLAVDGTCTVTVRWTPSAEGSFSGDVKVDGDATATATLTGSGVAGAHSALSVSPLRFDVGRLPRLQSIEKTFTYTNTGNVDVVPALDHLDPDATAISDLCTGRSLAPGAACTVTVRLTARSAVGGEYDFDVRLNASGTTVAAAFTAWIAEELDPLEVRGTLSANAFAGDTAKLDVVFKAVDSGPLRLDGARVTGDAGASVADDGCAGRRLASSDTCTVMVAFRADDMGTHTAVLTLTGDRIKKDVTLTLRTIPSPPKTDPVPVLERVVPPPVMPPPTAQQALATEGRTQLDAATKDLADGKADVKFANTNNNGSGTGNANTTTTLKPNQTTGIVMGGSGSSTTTSTQVDATKDDNMAVMSNKASASVAGSIASSQANTIISSAQSGGFTAGGGGFAAGGAGGFAGTGGSVGGGTGGGFAPGAVSSASAASASGQIKIAAKTCAKGKCTVKLTHPRTLGVYVGVLSVRHAATGKITSYRFVAVVPATLKVPSAAARCVTSGQAASTSTVRFGVSSGAKLRWSLFAAAKQPKQPRGCAPEVRWPKLTPAKKALASGAIAGTGTTRTTSLAKLLPPARLAKLAPGFYAIAFRATAGKMASPLAVWSFEVLPREPVLES